MSSASTRPVCSMGSRVPPERAELMSWLLDDGITVEQIRTAFMPMLLPARRVLGGDGTYVSARQGDDDLPRVRVELATGMAVSRAGD